MAKQKSGKNIWYDAIEEKYIKSEARPKGDMVFEVFNPNRVKGDCYTPYQGSGDWIESANQGLMSAANDNFRNRS